MSMMDSVRAFFQRLLLGPLNIGWGNNAYTTRSNDILARRDYRLGVQPRQLKKSRDGYDDNVTANFVGLALDRAVSLLFGQEVEFEFENETTQEFIDATWEANNKAILLHTLALYGGEDGTVFVKLIPDPVIGWRIIPQDPIFKDIITDPDDYEKVTAYITQYKSTDEQGKEIAKRETIFINEGGQSWTTRNEISTPNTGGKWQITDEAIWPFELPPIIHWKNLPSVGDVWGMPDVPDDVIDIQNKVNFNTSNINRIIRFYGQPFMWGKNMGNSELLDAGGNKIVSLSATGEINQLPPIGDLPGATSHVSMLRQDIFDITRNTDITSMKDKVGSLTNFGLRILFYDALNKLATKRELYGWGLREINRRLLLFTGQAPEDGEIVWKDPLPVDEKAERENYKMDLEMGIVSKETVATRLGYNWEQEKEKIAAEQEEANKNNVNIGGLILKNFEQGGGVGPGNEPEPAEEQQPAALAR